MLYMNTFISPKTAERQKKAVYIYMY